MFGCRHASDRPNVVGSECYDSVQYISGRSRLDGPCTGPSKEWEKQEQQQYYEHRPCSCSRANVRLRSVEGNHGYLLASFVDKTVQLQYSGQQLRFYYYYGLYG